jgi:predicted CXXCH cytochrome family protein
MFSTGKGRCPGLWALVLTALMASPGFLPPALSQEMPEPGNCVSCHQEIYGKSIPFRHQHAPFFNQECEKCHGTHEVIRAGVATTGQKRTGNASFRDEDFLEERTVLLKGMRPGTGHDVRVTFQDRDRRRVTEVFTDVEVVHAGAATGGVQDRAPPRISGVTVGPVERGPFLSTTIQWETDEPATSRVDYGFSEGYGSSVQKEDVWVKHHRVSVHGLIQGREYHFQVVSEDLYGNESRSADALFSTSAPTAPSAAASWDADTETAAGRLAVRQTQLFLVGSDLGLYLETSRPARVHVEWIPKDALPLNAGPASTEAGISVRLDDLNTGQALTIDACSQHGCHPPDTLGISHPVGVPLRNNMPSTVDLPTLEGGIITCVTCHKPHGGDRNHFAQDNFSKKICLTCHTEF